MMILLLLLLKMEKKFAFHFLLTACLNEKV